MCARILLPAADNSTQGFQARLDRIERRLSMGQDGAPAQASPVEKHGARPEAEAILPPQPTQSAPAPTPSDSVQEPPAPAAAEPEPAQAAAVGSVGITDVRRMWSEILDAVAKEKRYTWTLLSHNAQATSISGDTLTLSLVNAGARDAFMRSESESVLATAIFNVLGINLKIDSIVDPSAKAGGGSAKPKPAATPAAGRTSGVSAPEPLHEAAASAPKETEATVDPDASADRNDPVIDEEQIDHEALSSRELGAQVIEESGPERS